MTSRYTCLCVNNPNMSDLCFACNSEVCVRFRENLRSKTVFQYENLHCWLVLCLQQWSLCSISWKSTLKIRIKIWKSSLLTCALLGTVKFVFDFLKIYAQNPHSNMKILIVDLCFLKLKKYFKPITYKIMWGWSFYFFLLIFWKHWNRSYLFHIS